MENAKLRLKLGVADPLPHLHNLNDSFLYRVKKRSLVTNEVSFSVSMSEKCLEFNVSHAIIEKLKLPAYEYFYKT